MRDKNARIRHEVPDVEVAIGKVPTIAVEFMYLYDKGVRPTPVAVRNGTWSYALKDTAILPGNWWIQ